MVAKKSLNFKEWLKLNEVGTSTGDVAGFQRMVIPGEVRRKPVTTYSHSTPEEDPFFKKKKKNRD